MKRCFVLMPFAADFDGIWEHVIRPVITGRGHECTRADDMFVAGRIMDQVIASIRRADYVVADLSGRNPNVFYELGFAHALDKPSVLLVRDLNDVPFDLRDQRVLVYQDSASGVASLQDRLSRSVDAL
tara:strand:+ start:12226 stop:12609 length:384 start_codon:yes stop_codon:yes gene_type:complete